MARLQRSEEDLTARLQRSEAASAARELAEARSAAMSRPLYPEQSKIPTPAYNRSEDICRSVLEPCGAGWLGVQFDSQELESALRAADQLSLDSSPAEFSRALTIVRDTAATLHTNIQREVEASRISLLIVDELRVSHARARPVITDARDADHWNSFENDDDRRAHIAPEVALSEALRPKATPKKTKGVKGHKQGSPGRRPSVATPPSPSGPRHKRRQGTPQSATKRAKGAPPKDPSPADALADAGGPEDEAEVEEDE